jgi:periplasmic protein TonB
VASPASNASRPLEGTAPSASGASGSSNRPSVDITAVTTRDDFLLELGDALGGQASVRPVDSVNAALEFLQNTKRGQVLVFDSRDIASIREEVDLAHAEAPHAVMLVFATSDAEKQIGAAVKGSNIFAVLPIPIDKRKTAAILEGVITDAVAKKGSRAAAPAVTVEPYQPRSESAPSGPSSGSASKLVGLIGVAVALAIVGGLYMLFNKGKPAQAPVAAQPKHASVEIEQAAGADDETLAPKVAADVVLVKGSVDELLEKARAAMRERHYTEPAGDNALVYYRSAQAANGASAEALDGLARVASVLASRFEDALSAGRLDEAAGSLANFKAASPRDLRLPSLELKLATAQINKALADGNVDKAAALVRQAQQSTSISPDQLNKWRTDITRRQEDAKLLRLANLVSDRIRDGKLVDPAEDSAQAYLQQLREAAPTNATTQRAQRDLNSAYMRKAREAAVNKNQADEDRWLGEAKAGGVSASDLATFQRELVAARQKAAAAEVEHVTQLARDRIREGKLTDPAQDSAAFYVGQLQTTDPSNGAVASLSKDLAGKLIDRARSVARDPGKAALVDADLTQAKRWGADARDVAAVQQLQSNARNANASASRSSAPAVNVQALAAQLKRTHYVAPDYPANALSNKLSGVVTVEFTVGTNGETRDVRVTDASPPGVFDKSATGAVRRWRYEPVVANGAPVEIPVRTAIRFELPK